MQQQHKECDHLFCVCGGLFRLSVFASTEWLYSTLHGSSRESLGGRAVPPGKWWEPKHCYRGYILKSHHFPSLSLNPLKTFSLHLLWFFSTAPPGWLHSAGHRSAAGPQLGGLSTAGARHQRQGPPPGPAHRCPQRWHKVCRIAAPEWSQCWCPIQGERERERERVEVGKVIESIYCKEWLDIMTTGLFYRAAVCPFINISILIYRAFLWMLWFHVWICKLTLCFMWQSW